MDDLKQRLAALPPEQRELVLRQLQKKREAMSQQIQPQPRDGRMFPLSFAQERMWLLYQLDPASPLYNVSLTMRLAGAVVPERLQASLELLVARHEALRTTFVWSDDGVPQQRIAPHAALPLELVDLRAEPEAETRFHAQATAALRRPFDLENGPLARVLLYRLTEHEARLMLVMHHIVSDGWSLGVLTQELATLYGAMGRDERPTLPPLPVQVADFAVWQRQWLQGETLERLSSYWQRHLADAPRTLALPATQPPPPERTLRGERVPFHLDDALAERLKGMAQAEGLTRFMLLLAGFAAWLSRLTGQEEVVIGTPVSNRPQAETAGLLGVFVNTLALRVDLSGNPTGRELIERVRRVVLDGVEHQALPFAKLIDLLKVERQVNRAPLFQVSLGLQENPMRAMQLPGLEVEMLELYSARLGHTLPPLHTGMAMFDLTLHLSDVDGVVGGWLDYSTDLFDEAAVRRFAAQYQTLLAALLADPSRPIAGLPVLAPEETTQLAIGNATAHPWEGWPTLPALFEAQVQRSPNALAVREVGGRSLSFAEVEAQANQLAAFLHAQGVGLEDRVGVCVERTTEMIVALLAVLKVGAAYVPLPPSYPSARLAFMLDDAAPALLLTQGHLEPLLPPFAGPVLCLDRDAARIASAPPFYPQPVPPDAAAYLIYTSGSTSVPKGVLVAHRSAYNLVLSQIIAFALEPGCRCLQFASFSFDASVSEIFTTLGSGATLVLAPADKLLPGPELLALLDEEQITTVTLPPSALVALEGAALPHLRTLISAGEACPWSVAERWGRGRRMLNFYGPTEATVGCAFYLVGEAQPPGPITVPIGRAIPNARLYVVDERLQPVPFGVPGELLVGGEVLARGYLNRPALTAEKFVPDPFSPSVGGRLYRTGDKVRLWPDGTLEFLGRLDRQVKVRGYRIEVGEIEGTLRRHPAIRDAVVHRRAEGDHAQLVAYLIPRDEDAPALADLRHFLAERLPEYMVPARFIPLAAWPLTSRGKIDFAALPDPDQAMRPDHAPVAPRDEAEAHLAAIWRALLRVESVSVQDSFFELGGDSILSIQMVTRAREIGLHLSPNDVFKHQSIAALVAVARRQATASRAEQGLVVGAVPLTPIQQWFFEQAFPQPHHWNQAVALEMDGLLHPLHIEESVRLLLQHHDALRLRFRQGADGWEQYSTAPDDALPVRHVDLTLHPPAQWPRLIAEESAQAQATLNLTEGPLFRVVAFYRGAGEGTRLLLVAHHLVTDAVSWRILVEDFRTLYADLSAGQQGRLPAKSSSFRQWAEGLRDYAQQDEARARLAAWLPPPGDLPMPMPQDLPGGREANTEQSRRAHTLTLPADWTTRLLHTVPRAYHTRTQEVLLAALVLAWQSWSGADSLWVALEGHGRESPAGVEADLTRTVGWFTTIFPVRLAVGNPQALGSLLMAVKEQLRALPLNGMSYGLLRYLGGPEEQAALRALPAPPIGFNFLGQQGGEAGIGFGEAEVGETRAPQNPRPHPLALEAFLLGDELHLSWQYSAALHRPETILALASAFDGWLRALIEHCEAPDAGGYSPSDFPEANLDQSGLDNVLSELFD